jgi:hypothetical protein
MRRPAVHLGLYDTRPTYDWLAALFRPSPLSTLAAAPDIRPFHDVLAATWVVSRPMSRPRSIQVRWSAGQPRRAGIETAITYALPAALTSDRSLHWRKAHPHLRT